MTKLFKCSPQIRQSFVLISCRHGNRKSACIPAAASSGSNGQDIDVEGLLRKYSVEPDQSVSSRKKQVKTDLPALNNTAPPAPGFQIHSGVTVLVLFNFFLFFAATIGNSPWVTSLAINPPTVKWWSFFTSVFVHHNLEQLLRNSFIVFFFSQTVYHELGWVGVWFSYMFCGLCANLASWMFLAGSVSAKALAVLGLASSGGALGIFLAAVTLSFRPTLSWLLGAMLSSFVIRPLLTDPIAAVSVAPLAPSAVLEAGSALVSGSWTAVAGMLMNVMKQASVKPGNAWIFGSIVGSAVVILLARLPGGDEAH